MEHWMTVFFNWLLYKLILVRYNAEYVHKANKKWKYDGNEKISLVIKTAAAPVRCNDIAPLRWKLGGKWYYSFPALRDCAEPAQLPVDPVKISDVNVLDLGLGVYVEWKGGGMGW
jgi:hypothetical protein